MQGLKFKLFELLNMFSGRLRRTPLFPKNITLAVDLSSNTQDLHLKYFIIFLFLHNE